MCKKKFLIIGLTDSQEQFFIPEIQQIIRNGKTFSGGKRHRQIMERWLPENARWIDVTVPLENVFAEYHQYDNIVVFASGDPLFYGYAVTLRREFPQAELTVYPAFNSLQLLAHKLMLPYADMMNVSVTGRPWKNLDVALMENRSLIGVLTDRKKTPAEIARRLLYYGYDNYRMYVGECLGNTEEKVQSITLQDAIGREFEVPNCVILEMSDPRKRFFGIPENLFCHLEGRENMITKMPVRLLSLAMLDLYGKSVMWDIGFCTGSVSIEAKLQFPQLDVIAFERREESRRLFDDNCRKFGCPGIESVIADFMDCDVESFPRPDAVFIGGHGGRLGDMVDKVCHYMRPGGALVFNSVSAESCDNFIKAAEKCGKMISARHTLKLDEHNPITIIKAE